MIYKISVKPILAIGAISVMAFFAGCADQEAVRIAREAEEASSGERTVSAIEVGLGPDSVLTLQRGFEIARSYNPSLAVARRRVEAEQSRFHQTAADRLPQITLSDKTQINNSSGIYKLGKSHSGGVSVSQLLFDFGSTDALVRKSAEELLATQLDLESAAVDVEFQVRQAFFKVLQQQALVTVAQETVQQFEKRFEQVKGFVEVGTRTKYDMTKVQVDLGNAQLNRVRARTALAVNQAVLNNVLGLAEDARFALEKPKASDEVNVPLDTWVKQARQNQPRLVAQDARERAAQAAVDSAVADLYPGFQFQAVFSWNGAYSPLSWSWLVGPVANWLIYGGGRKTERIKELAAGLRQSRAQRAQTEQQIFLELRQGWAQLEDARERLKIVDLTLKQAEENLTLVQGRYEIGRASSVELTDAQTALSNARGERVLAEYDVEIAIAQLKKSAGVSEKKDE